MVQNRPQYLRTFLTAFLAIACAFEAHAIAFSNRYRSPRNPEREIRKATTLIVLHTTEAPARSSLNKLCERGEAHYCVVEDGTVYRIVDRDREAFHAGRSMWEAKEDCDTYSIGIEIVGYHDKPVTVEQLTAIRELVAKLQKIYGLADERVICHSHIAYGAPNKWQKKRHRGRKRCGMLFAMPSVRKQLELEKKPAVDPDVKARRLVQADPYLGKVLYGRVDTMASHYANLPAPSEKKGIFAGLGSLFGGTSAKASKPAPAKPTPKSTASKPAPAKPAPTKSTVAKPEPAKPVSKPVAVKPKPVKPASKSIAVKPAAVKPAAAKPVAAKPVALKPVITKPAAPHPAVPRSEKEIASWPEYQKGGPVNMVRTPYKIAGPKWNSSDTYYVIRGKLVPGDRVDPKRIVEGTILYFRK